MILEGIVTTLNDDQSVNISPMGPLVDDELESFELRPFKTSRTFINLKRHGFGVLHVIDDVLLLAQAAINQWIETPALCAAESIPAQRIVSANQAFEFAVQFIDDSVDRATVKCVVKRQHLGPRFFGFNRAKHMVLEAAILATRINFLPFQEIQSQFSQFNTVVGKTGGEREKRAMDLLNQFLDSHKSSMVGEQTL